MFEICDGLEALRSVMNLGEIASLMERRARWSLRTVDQPTHEFVLFLS
jgi:hypothetical protein